MCLLETGLLVSNDSSIQPLAVLTQELYEIAWLVPMAQTMGWLLCPDAQSGFPGAGWQAHLSLQRGFPDKGRG